MLMIYWETIDFAQAIKRVEEEKKKPIETHSTLRSAWILHFQLLLYRLEWICNGFRNVFRVLIFRRAISRSRYQKLIFISSRVEKL